MMMKIIVPVAVQTIERQTGSSIDHRIKRETLLYGRSGKVTVYLQKD
jgi:hypothetical protein